MKRQRSQSRSGHKSSASGASSRDPYLNIEINGELFRVAEGLNLAAALWSLGWRAFGSNAVGSMSSVFCGMGVCFDCLVIVDGQPNTRACITPVRQGMRVEIPAARKRVAHES